MIETLLALLPALQTAVEAMRSPGRVNGRPSRRTKPNWKDVSIQQ